MGRLGLTQDELVALIRSHKFPPSLRVEGLMTHLADADGSNPDATEEQISRFNRSPESRSGRRVPRFSHSCVQ